MDWEGEAKAHPDEPVVIPARSDDGHGDSNKERCVICLMALRDRTIVGVCGHEFCVSLKPKIYVLALTIVTVCVSNYTAPSLNLSCCGRHKASYIGSITSNPFAFLYPILLIYFFRRPCLLHIHAGTKTVNPLGAAADMTVRMYRSMGKSVKEMPTMFGRNGTFPSTRPRRSNSHQSMFDYPPGLSPTPCWEMLI